MAPVVSIYDREREGRFDMRCKPILDSSGRAFKKLKKQTTKCFSIKIVLIGE